MELIWGDDTVALDAAARAGGPAEVVDAAVTEAADIAAKAGGSLFGPSRLVVRNADRLDPSAVALLATAGGEVVLRCDGNAPAKLRKAVRDASGTVTEHRLPRDVAGFARAHAATLGLQLTRDGVAALTDACGSDTALARSVLEACSLAGITKVTARQVAALCGDAAPLHAAAVANAVRRGDLPGALDALERCGADHHAVLGALRRTLEGVGGAEVAEAIAAAELRLRSGGRDAAVWVCVQRCVDALGSRT